MTKSVIQSSCVVIKSRAVKNFDKSELTILTSDSSCKKVGQDNIFASFTTDLPTFCSTRLHGGGVLSLWTRLLFFLLQFFISFHFSLTSSVKGFLSLSNMLLSSFPQPFDSGVIICLTTSNLVLSPRRAFTLSILLNTIRLLIFLKLLI